MTSSSNTHQDQEPVPDTNRNVVADPSFLPYTITQIPFLFSPPGFASHQVIVTLSFPNMALAISVWYLNP